MSSDVEEIVLPVLAVIGALCVTVYVAGKLIPGPQQQGTGRFTRGGSRGANVTQNLNPLRNTAGTTSIAGTVGNLVASGYYTGTAVSPKGV